MASRPKPPARLQASETASQLLRRVAQKSQFGLGPDARRNYGNHRSQWIGKDGASLDEIVLNAVLPASFEGIKLGMFPFLGISKSVVWLSSSLPSLDFLLTLLSFTRTVLNPNF
ncbi:hypothetical protein AAMO2058_001736300 [Amorphochlora amoebiformis]